MRVVEARQHERAARVYDARLRPRQRAHLRGRADERDAVAVDGHGLGFRALLVQRAYACVDDDEVGLELLRGQGRGR